MPLLPRENLKSPATFGSWKLGDEISKGSFGTVFRCHCLEDSQEPEGAVKVVRCAAEVVGECLAESEKLRHHNLIAIKEIIATKRRICVRMELCIGRELFDYAGLLTDTTFLRSARELVSAVSLATHVNNFSACCKWMLYRKAVIKPTTWILLEFCRDMLKEESAKRLTVLALQKRMDRIKN